MALKVHHLRPAPGAKTPKTRKGMAPSAEAKRIDDFQLA